MRLESKRASIPTLYLELGNKVTRLLAEPGVADKWDEPSAVEQMTVGAVAAHLVRAFTTTVVYGHADDAELDPEDDVDASRYYFRTYDRAQNDMDDLNAAILARSFEDAEPGPAAVRERMELAMGQLKLLLVGEPGDRGIEVFDGMVMKLDDYLVTRMVEAVVHSDDLAQSIGVETPKFAPDVMDLVLATLLGVARERHSDLSVLRAFVRDERSGPPPLPVF